MSPEWKQRIARSISAALLVGAASIYAESPGVVYSQTIERRGTNLEATVSNVTLAFQRKDLNAVKRYAAASDFGQLEENFKKLTSEYLEGKEGFDCIVYGNVGTRPLHPGLNPNDIRLLVRWFYAPSVSRGHTPYGSGSIYFTPDGSSPLGWRLKLVAKDPESQDQDLAGEGNWVACPYPLFETKIPEEKTLSTSTEKPVSRRRLLYNVGLTSKVDTSGSAGGRSDTFLDMQIYASGRLNYKGQDHINVTLDWKLLPDGRYVAGHFNCEDSLKDPEVLANNLIELSLALIRANPDDDLVPEGHSNGGLVVALAMQKIKEKIEADPSFPLGPENFHPVIIQSPIGGVAKSWPVTLRGLMPWSCEFLGMPKTNSPAVTNILSRWEQRTEVLKKLEEDVRWWSSKKLNKRADGRVTALVNIPDRVYSKDGIPRSRLHLTWLDITKNLPKEILTQEVPGAQNYRRKLYNGTLNHDAFLKTDEGKELIGTLIGKQRQG